MSKRRGNDPKCVGPCSGDDGTSLRTSTERHPVTAGLPLGETHSESDVRANAASEIGRDCRFRKT